MVTYSTKSMNERKSLHVRFLILLKIVHKKKVFEQKKIDSPCLPGRKYVNLFFESELLCGKIPNKL